MPLSLPDGTHAFVSELSASGMTLQSVVPLRVGQVLLLDLRPPGSRLSFTARGVVVAVHPHAACADARIRFTDLRLHDVH
jgi:hypothetical protein